MSLTPATFTEVLHKAWRRRVVTWRTYGMRGELRRPMIHRFEVKGGDTLMDVMLQSIVTRNPLTDFLTGKRK